MNVEDLQPKNFTVKIKEVELSCSPLRLSHALTVSKMGELLKSPEQASIKEMKQAEEEIDSLFAELIPELKGVRLGMQDTVELLSQMMDLSETSESKVMKDLKIELDSDPKVEKAG